eukprot:CAMPEP_0201590514 /NCGR_PEP_ID=MMETSP0190_2-20130828/178570_1 /ASSEMBLY_ACC=CAM_ASM_000263 /TAXON_ID=37353 /ORGANISM="Rosalina sp." /LENGTH=316 /DNA_ID=CAMNT_0048046823 /DNA_START=35 /DNA_END=986 /DNA_ORIENTATION=-
MASTLLRSQILKSAIHHASPMTSTITITKFEYHGGRHFKKYNPGHPQGGMPTSIFGKVTRVERNVGAPRSIPVLDPTKDVPQMNAPYYQDYERQISAARLKEAIEASESKPVQLLESEQGESDETALTERKPETALIDLETDPFTSPSDLVQEYGYSDNADLEYYNTPNTKVLEFHTAETVGRPFVETPDPVFVPDEHWVWEDNLEAQQDAHIYEETVMDRMARKGKHYVMFDIFSALLQTTMSMFQPKVTIMYPFEKGPVSPDIEVNMHYVDIHQERKDVLHVDYVNYHVQLEQLQLKQKKERMVHVEQQDMILI